MGTGPGSETGFDSETGSELVGYEGVFEECSVSDSQL